MCSALRGGCYTECHGTGQDHRPYLHASVRHRLSELGVDAQLHGAVFLGLKRPDLALRGTRRLVPITRRSERPASMRVAATEAGEPAVVNARICSMTAPMAPGERLADAIGRGRPASAAR